MQTLKILFDILMHLDKYLELLVKNCGIWTYVIVFLVIFSESGIILTPFLPGDAFLFALGAASGANILNVWGVSAAVWTGAVTGLIFNYWIGSLLGPKIFQKRRFFLNQKHLEQTHRFFEKYGGKTIILSRFLPAVRTYAPFVAGVGKMSYKKYLTYNLIGAFLWVIIVVGAGYFLGTYPLVKNNFSIVIFIIIIVSMMPVGWEILSHWLANRRKSQK